MVNGSREVTVEANDLNIKKAIFAVGMIELQDESEPARSRIVTFQSCFIHIAQNKIHLYFKYLYE